MPSADSSFLGRCHWAVVSHHAMRALSSSLSLSAGLIPYSFFLKCELNTLHVLEGYHSRRPLKLQESHLREYPVEHGDPKRMNMYKEVLPGKIIFTSNSVRLEFFCDKLQHRLMCAWTIIPNYVSFIHW